MDEAQRGEVRGGDEAEDEDEGVSTRLRIMYSLPALILSTVGVMLSTYIPKFYSDSLGVPVGVVGTISTFALLFDALSDPLVGYYSDFTRTRWGRRRPFIFVGGVCLGLVSICLLAPPRGLDQNGLVTWAAVFIIAVFLFNTMVRVPWFALGMELTSHHDEKTSVFAVREVMWIVGTILGAALPLIVEAALGKDESSSGQRQQFGVIGVAVAIGSVASVFFCVRAVRERRFDELGPVAKGALTFGVCSIFGQYFELFRDVVRYRPALCLLFSTAIYGVAVVSNAFFFAYFVEYVLEDDDKLELVLVIYILSGVVFIPAWVRLAKRFQKVQVLRLAMAIQSVSLFMTFFFVGPGDFEAYVVLVLAAGISFGGFSAVKFSMIADIADADEWRNLETSETQRREGKIQGLFDVVTKLLQAALIGPATILLESNGYEPNEVQPQKARDTIRVLYALAPSLLAILAILVTLPYDLTRERHLELKRVVRDIKAGRSPDQVRQD